MRFPIQTIAAALFLVALLLQPAAAEESQRAYENYLLQGMAFSFEEFVRYQLTHPEFGAYSKNVLFGAGRGEIESTHQSEVLNKEQQARRILRPKSGKTTFGTSPSTNAPVFGALLAIRLFELWQALEAEEEEKDRGQQLFYIIEMGGGVGRLAGDVLKFAKHGPHPKADRPKWQQFYGLLRYVGIEISQRLVENQNRENREYVRDGRFLALQGDALALSQHPFFYLSDLDREELLLDNTKDISSYPRSVFNPIRGTMLSNELPDVFPFHIVRMFQNNQRPPEIVAVLPTLPQDTLQRIFRTLQAALKAGDRPFPESHAKYNNSEDLQNLYLQLANTSRNLLTFPAVSQPSFKDAWDRALPPAIPAGTMLLTAEDFEMVRDALYRVTKLPGDFKVTTGDSKIEQAATEASLNPAEKIALELVERTGFHPITLPMEMFAGLTERFNQTYRTTMEAAAGAQPSASRFYVWPLLQYDWMGEVAQVLDQGYVITIDYPTYHSLMYRYYGTGPAGKFSMGTRYPTHTAPLFNLVNLGLGWYDMTPGLDFAVAVNAGEAAGLDLLAYDTELHFLAHPRTQTGQNAAYHYYESFEDKSIEGWKLYGTWVQALGPETDLRDRLTRRKLLIKERVQAGHNFAVLIHAKDARLPPKAEDNSSKPYIKDLEYVSYDIRNHNPGLCEFEDPAAATDAFLHNRLQKLIYQAESYK